MADKVKWLKRVFSTCVAVGFLLFAIAWWQHSSTISLVAGVVTVCGMSAGLGVPAWSGYRFTLWILIANLSAMLTPQRFQQIGSFSLTDSWLLLIVVQGIMFGMGTQMSVRDFAHVATMPKGVIVGLSCQFLIMPLLGYGLSSIFRLPAEIAAGVILVGSCSSGLASNVMTFMAKGNLALSVTMTAIATAMAPVMTPLWMKVLAGSMVDVDAFKMSLDIVKMVIVPILAAFVHDWLSSYGRSTRFAVKLAAAIGLVWILFLVCGGWAWLQSSIAGSSEKLQSILAIPGFLAAAFVVGTVYHYAVRQWSSVKDWMPIVSMFGIVYFTLVTTAKGRDQLLDVGFLLLLVAFLHNVLGYTFGYWGSRMLGMNRQDARTIAIEVGTQNGAMATGLSKAMGKLETVGLASIVFGPLMNITGSVLANYWRQKPAEDTQSTS